MHSYNRLQPCLDTDSAVVALQSSSSMIESVLKEIHHVLLLAIQDTGHHRAKKQLRPQHSCTSRALEREVLVRAEFTQLCLCTEQCTGAWAWRRAAAQAQRLPDAQVGQQQNKQKGSALLLSCKENCTAATTHSVVLSAPGFCGNIAPFSCRPALRAAPRPAAPAIECVALCSRQVLGLPGREDAGNTFCLTVLVS